MYQIIIIQIKNNFISIFYILKIYNFNFLNGEYNLLTCYFLQRSETLKE